MRPFPGPRHPADRPRRPRWCRVGRLTTPALLGAVLLSACAPTVPGLASPSAPVDGTPASRIDEPHRTPASSAITPAPDTSGSSAGTTARPSTPASSEGLRTGRASGTTPATAGWSIVAPAGLQSWETIPGDDVSQGWRSGDCIVMVSAPAEVPAMTDERLARAHAKYALNTFVAEVDPTMTETGEARGQQTDPLRVSDPTRLDPPAVHLQLSGFRFEFPAVGLTDQTYSFVTQGGGQGLVVSTTCRTADFTARYDTEIAPLISDLGVDTGI